ncbi:MAG: glycoside hydrolase family 2 TIM barrel-domain containing protein [Tidjanibacter sp.]|nr:glycoside hydrolase family 2 TIM barrel-domain containing protein [Tidjanibacter sp.]
MKRFSIKYSILQLFALFGVLSIASARETYNINREWKFYTYDENSTSIVNLPHQWNQDALGGRADYFRGVGNYMRYIDLRPEWSNKRIYIRFGGVNLVADLLVNGRYVGRHEGGSGAFAFDITNFVRFDGRDLIWVIVSNAPRIDVMPTAGNEISYGGIYRDVEIIITQPTTISVDDYASDGVAIVSKSVSAQKVEGEVQVKVDSRSSGNATVQATILQPDGSTVLTGTAKVRLQEDKTAMATIPFEIANPKLWDGINNPYLYTFKVSLLSGGKEQDAVELQSGFRYYEVSTDGGFRLNGRPYPIHGVLLHRDRPLSGTAVDERDLAEDIGILREMGANAVRVVGGEHHRAFYSLCDRYGIIVINDLPFVGTTTLNGKGFFNTEGFRRNGKEQLREMIMQLYNHPSVMVWNLFSELETKGESAIGYIKELNSLAKELDHNRFTSGWSNQDGEINFITDLIVWSHTFGWMDGLPSDITVWQEQMHSTPSWSTFKSAVSYKCGGSIFHQSDVLGKPIAAGAWHPERWQTYFHETYIDALRADSLFWGTFVDCLFDYGSVSSSHQTTNDMGVVSFNRQVRKDAFYRYKAEWNTDQKFLQIAEKRWALRTDTLQNIKVYSNLPQVDIYINGEKSDRVSGLNGVFRCDSVVLHRGRNLIEASSGIYYDNATIEVPSNYFDSL